MGSEVICIGVAGGSCSGKTTIAGMLVEALGLSNCLLIAQDSYYRDWSHLKPEEATKFNFDDPKTVDLSLMHEQVLTLKKGKSVQVPIYEFVTHRRIEKTRHFEPKSVIVLDGMWLLSEPKLRDVVDIGIFVHASPELRLDRKLKRDEGSRGWSPEKSMEQFQNFVEPMHRIHVEPFRKFADIVLSGEESSEKSINGFFSQFGDRIDL